MDDNGEIRSFNPGSSGISGTDAPEEDAASEAEAVPGIRLFRAQRMPPEQWLFRVLKMCQELMLRRGRCCIGRYGCAGRRDISADMIAPGAGDVQKMNEASEAATVPESGNVAE